ncbi:uncharacterized protein LOC144355116 [Saccoglossus kowalevskii]
MAINGEHTDDGSGANEESDTKPKTPHESKSDPSLRSPSPYDRHVKALVNVTMNNIKQVGRYLDLTDSELEAILYNHSSYGPGEIKYQIVKQWILKNGNDAIDEWFAQVLRHVGLHKDAKEFLTSPSSSSSYHYPEQESQPAGPIHVLPRARVQDVPVLPRVPSTSNLYHTSSHKSSYNFQFFSHALLCIIISALVPYAINTVAGLGITNIECTIVSALCVLSAIVITTIIACMTSRDKGPPVEIRKPAKIFTGKQHEDNLNHISTTYRRIITCTSESEAEVVIQALCGLGGCGKTEIATRYIWQNWKKYSGGVFYISGQSSSHLDFGFKKMLQKAGVELRDEDETPNYIRMQALKFLHQTKNWLLVIDNADDPSIVKTVIPENPRLRNGHIIITSRATNTWDGWYNVQTIRVSHLTPHDSAIYLLRRQCAARGKEMTNTEAERKLNQLRNERKDEYDALLWIGDLTALQGLPLALQQADKYIAMFNMTFMGYKKEYTKCRLSVFQHSQYDPVEGWLKSNGLNPEYAPSLRQVVRGETLKLKTISSAELRNAPIYMKNCEIIEFQKAQRETNSDFFALMIDPCRECFLTTWKMNFDKLCCDTATKEFMLLCSCLASRIQIALLANGADKLNQCQLRMKLLSECKDSSKGSTGSRLITSQIRTLVRVLMESSFASMITENTSDSNELDKSGTFTMHHLVQQVMFLDFVGRNEKIQAVNNAILVLENAFPDIDDVGDDNFEALYGQPISDEHSLIVFHTLALARQIESLGCDDILNLRSTHNLFSAVGIYLRRLGRARDARRLYKLMARLSRWCKPIREELLKEELRCLGKVNFELGRYEDAERYFKEAVDLYRKLNGDDNIKTVYALQGLVKVQQNNRKYMQDPGKRLEIKKLLHEILDRKRKFFELKVEKNDYTIAHALYQIGRFYQDIGEYDEAHEYLQESLDIKQRYWESRSGTAIHHIDVAIGSTNLARNYLLREDKRDLDTSLKLLETAWNIKQKKLPETNESYQLGLCYLVSIYREKGDKKKCKEYWEKIQLDEYKERFHPQRMGQKGVTDEDINKKNTLKKSLGQEIGTDVRRWQTLDGYIV